MQQRWAIPQNNVEESAGHQHGWLGESFFTTVALQTLYRLSHSIFLLHQVTGTMLAIERLGASRGDMLIINALHGCRQAGTYVLAQFCCNSTPKTCPFYLI